MVFSSSLAVFTEWSPTGKDSRRLAFRKETEVRYGEAY